MVQCTHLPKLFFAHCCQKHVVVRDGNEHLHELFPVTVPRFDSLMGTAGIAHWF